MVIELIIALTALIGLMLLGYGLRRIGRRRPVTGGIQAMLGVALLAGAGLALSLALNLHTYRRLTQETAAAEIAFAQVGPRRFRAELVPTGGTAQRFDLEGDEWQLDARILKWRGYAVVLGFDTRYRLDRLSGRYREIERERHDPRTVYPLNGEPGTDLWSLARLYHGWLPWIDAVYGNAAYLPMADGARFQVYVSASGLVARPANAAAEAAIQGWR